MRAEPSIWTVMLALLGVHMAGMGAFLTIPVLAPAISAETGLPASLAGFHTAFAYAGAMASGLFSGRWLRRFGGVRLCQAALLCIALGLALATLGHPLAFVASALVAGFGHGPVTPAGSHLLAPRTPPARRSLIFSLKQTGVPAGAMLVAVVAPGLAARFGWRVGVLAMAAFALLLALALQPLRARLDADRSTNAPKDSPLTEAGASLGLLREQPVLRALTLAACGFGVAQFCFGTFFVAWQVQEQGRSLEEAGWLLALAQGAGVAGRIGWAMAADRLGAMAVLRSLVFAITLACAALALAGPGWPGFFVALLGMAMGATAIGWNGVLLGEAARVAPAGQVGAATAALGFAFGATMVLAPPIFTGVVALGLGYAAGFGLCAAAALGGGIALLRLPRTIQRP
jgi:MFS family permease